ncbi:MAG: hypothetical protein E7474_13910 [Ruminococcaceae bacterium]|nr:hypothetical protein [Oscillospiraceae bacterium]
MPTFVIFVIGVIVLFAVIFFKLKRNKAIQENGIEADAVVSRVVEHEDRDDDGHSEVTYTYYVRYQTQDRKTVEAKLGNAPAYIREGAALRIKYLPDKPKYVIPAK